MLPADLRPARRLSAVSFSRSEAAFWAFALPDLAPFCKAEEKAHWSRLVLPARPDISSGHRGMVGTAADYWMGLRTGDSLSRLFDGLDDEFGTTIQGRRSPNEFLADIARSLMIGIRVMTERSRRAVAANTCPRGLGAGPLLMHTFAAYARLGGKAVPEVERVALLGRWNNGFAEEKWTWARDVAFEAIPKPVRLELRDVVHALAPLLPPGRPDVTYNPVFGARGALTGSDGDLLCGDTLYELKVRVDACTAETLRQLLAYVCLEHLARRQMGESERIRGVGIINPRFAVRREYAVADLVAQAGGGTVALLADRMDAFLRRPVIEAGGVIDSGWRELVRQALANSRS